MMAVIYATEFERGESSVRSRLSLESDDIQNGSLWVFTCCMETPLRRRTKFLRRTEQLKRSSGESRWNTKSNFALTIASNSGSDGTRTRGLRRDRPSDSLVRSTANPTLGTPQPTP